jgi:membrane fusion protein, multidrug efflux system
MVDEPKVAVKARRGRRRLVIPVVVVAGLAAALWGGRRILYATTHESTNDAFVGGHLVPVMAKVGGFVADVRVVENQRVAAGDTLIVLDDAELKQRVHQAEAELAAAVAAAGSEGTTGQASARVDQAAGQREALTAQIAAARAQADRAQRDVDRIRGLAEKEIVSRQQLDAAEATAASALASVTALEQQHKAAAANVMTARAGVTEAAAGLAAARVVLESARLQLSYGTIVAPASGLVSKRSAEPGQLLQPGQPLLTIVADSDVYVSANFKETQLSGIARGKPVVIDVDAYGDCEARGEVDSIGGATGSQFSLIPPDNATGNFTKVVQRVSVRIRIVEGCGPGRPLRPGMSVVVHVNTK